MSTAFIQEIEHYIDEMLTEGIYAEYMGSGSYPDGSLIYPMYRYTDRAEGLLVVDQTDNKVFVQDLITGESGVFNREQFHDSADKRGFFHANF